MTKPKKVRKYDSLENVITRYGGERSRTAGVRVKGRRQLNLGALESLEQMRLVKRIIGELPGDALREVRVKVDEPGTAGALNAALDVLNARTKFLEAAYAARLYGGAALWMVCDGGGLPGEPLDYATLRSVKSLVLMDRYELSVSSTAGGIGSFLDDDPASANFLNPVAYFYTPYEGNVAPSSGVTSYSQIHASRLIRFYGDSVPRRLRGQYDYWGAPVIEGVFNELGQYRMASEAGAEVVYEYGGKVYKLDNLQELLSSQTGQEDLADLLLIQAEAFSTLRAYMVGPGQDLVQFSPTLAGWTDIYDRLAQNLATAAAMPITKLFGQAPGGLSTDDGSALSNWSAQVSGYQTLQLRPAANQLVTTLLRSAEGPTRGQEPDEWEVVFAPYQVPSEAEAAATLRDRAEGLAVLLDRQVISVDEARATLENDALLSLMDDDADPTRADAGDGDTPPQAVRDNAARALKVRASKPPSERGMTSVGLARARDLANGRAVSLETARRMVAYFERHEVDKDGETWDEQGKGWQAWMGWGGDEGWRWAKRIVAAAERETP
jgi:phage-related protein (TIGR01555 family)